MTSPLYTINKLDKQNRQLLNPKFATLARYLNTLTYFFVKYMKFNRLNLIGW